MNILRIKQGRSVSGRGLPTVASCLSRCARSGLSRRGHVTASTCSQSLDGDDRTSELETGQKRIPEVTHSTQGAEKVIGIQIQGQRTQCFSCMEISMWSTDTMLQPQQVTIPTKASGCSLVYQQVRTSSHR